MEPFASHENFEGEALVTYANVVHLPVPGSWSCLTRTDDVDRQADAQPEWRQDYQQLSPGRFRGTVQHFQLPGLRLVREESNQALRQRGDLGSGVYGFAMVVRQAAPAIFFGQQVAGDAMMAGRGDGLDLLSSQDFCLIAAVVDQPLLGALWERMYDKPLPLWLESQLVLPTRSAAAHALKLLHAEMMSAAIAPAMGEKNELTLRQMRDAVLIEWIEALPAKVDATDAPKRCARKLLVDRACALMLSDADEPLSMLDICVNVGSSRRKLNYCFQEFLGINPVRYQRTVRLNFARRQLKQANGNVQAVAAQCGFWHMGQFSRYYMLQFGELPSDTLKRAVCG